MIKTLKEKVAHQDPWVKLYHNQVEFPQGFTGTYTYAERPNGCVAAVVNEKNELLLIRNFRYAINSFCWEIPGGAIDEGETKEVSMVRELQEETGITRNHIVQIDQIGDFYALASFVKEMNTYFYIKLKEGYQLEIHNEETEVISEAKFYSLEECDAMVKNGNIVDLATLFLIEVARNRINNT